MPKKTQSTSSRAKPTKVTAQQKHVRRQQVFLAVVGIVVILAMVMALVVNN